MLNSFCKGAAVLAAVIGFTASAHAEEHVILIVDGSYFPSVIQAGEGDTLTFQNDSTGSHIVSGADDAWTSGSIGVNDVFSIELTDATPSAFSGSSDGADEAEGEIIWQ